MKKGATKWIERTFWTVAGALLLGAAVTPVDMVAGSPARPEATLEEVRRATARFADFERAVEEGWGVALTECMASEEGAMGYHYGNPTLIEDGALDELRPEALMYEPTPDGTLEFVGIEYLLPVDQWVADEAPTLLGQTMVRNDEFGLWTLHVWWKENPAGTFNPWNAAVTCAHAG